MIFPLHIHKLLPLLLFQVVETIMSGPLFDLLPGSEDVLVFTWKNLCISRVVKKGPEPL